MEVKPVRQIGKPKYPLKTEVGEEELKKRIPKRWMQCPAAKIALGTLAVVTLTGCVAQGGLAEATLKTEASASAIDAMPMGEVLTPSVMVAPLFQHGEGRGAFGGVASISVYLSEDEALAVINEAAKEYGLEFSNADGTDFYNVLQPVTDLNPSGTDGETPKPEDTFIMLKADFSDSEHGIAIEFITKDDVIAWSREASTSTVEVYDTKDAAAQLSESLENASANGQYTAAVLYDPCESPNSEAETKDSSKRQLKKQAIDFFEWLRSQGVI